MMSRSLASHAPLRCLYRFKEANTCRLGSTTRTTPAQPAVVHTPSCTARTRCTASHRRLEPTLGSWSKQQRCLRVAVRPGAITLLRHPLSHFTTTDNFASTTGILGRWRRRGGAKNASHMSHVDARGNQLRPPSPEVGTEIGLDSTNI